MKILFILAFIFTSVFAKAQVTPDSTRQPADTGITRDPSYPGGEVAWRKFVQNIIAENIQAITLDGKSGVCKLRFLIDEEGKVLAVAPLTMQGSELAYWSMKAIKKTKWTPAIKNGKNVKSYREVGVHFKIGNQ